MISILNNPLKLLKIFKGICIVSWIFLAIFVLLNVFKIDSRIVGFILAFIYGAKGIVMILLFRLMIIDMKNEVRKYRRF